MKKQINSNKTVLAIVVSVIITILIVGGGIYVLQSSIVKETRQELEQRLSKVNDQLIETQNQFKKQIEIEEETKETLYELTDEYCSLDECLFNINQSVYPLGIATIKGYFSPVERTAWEETKTCDSFTVTGGSEEFTRAMIGLVDMGNTVHSKNELNQPVINLGWDMLNDAEKEIIKNSTVENQKELIVFKKSPGASGAPICYTDVTVLRVK